MSTKNKNKDWKTSAGPVGQRGGSVGEKEGCFLHQFKKKDRAPYTVVTREGGQGVREVLNACTFLQSVYKL